MAKIWVISDLHLGHANMYKFTMEDGSRVRPEFDSDDEADAFMIQAWNDTVKPEHHIYCLGDFAFGRPAILKGKLLNGHKRLILGNHDDPDPRRYLDVGFKKIRGMHQIAGLWLTHAPMHWGYEHSENRKDKFIGNIHGHVHRMPSPTRNHFNVCVEWTRYRPIELDQVVEIMKKRVNR